MGSETEDGLTWGDARLPLNQLRHAERFASVGRLTASMAHEINNPLESVTNLLYLARHTEDPAALDEYLVEADRELRRIATITTQTLLFHRRAARPLPLRAADLFDSIAAVYAGRLRNARVRVDRRVRTTQAVVCLDGEVRQLISTLVGNALDAMGGKPGRLLLRAAEATQWSTGRRGLRFTVANTGPGMPPETLARLFQPFFSTKPSSGTGLGLWISQDIARRHHGTLVARSRGQALRPGSVFAFWLPL